MSAHFEIHVNDMDRAKKFYGGVLAWQFTPMAEAGGDEVDYHLIESQDIGHGHALTGGLMRRMEGNPEPGGPIRGCTLTFEVADVDATYEKSPFDRWCRGAAPDRLSRHRPRRLLRGRRRQRLWDHNASRRTLIMPTEILMPALSPTMEEGTLAKWLVKEGDSVSSGDIIAEIETDKATMEFEAVDEGTIGKVLVDEGTEGVKVNTPIAVLLEEGESADHIGHVSCGCTAASDSASASGNEKAAEAATASAGATPAAPDAPTAPDTSPDWPEGTEMVKMTVREALNSAMAEEMRRDENVFIMGEEVAEYQGAYKITQNLLDEFGAKRVIDTPITEHGFAGIGVGASWGGLQAHCRVHDLELRHAGHRPDHQLSRQDALYVRRPDGQPDRFPRPQRCGGPRGRPALPGLRRLVCSGARPQGGAALFGSRCQGPAEIRDPRSRTRLCSWKTRSFTASHSRFPSSTISPSPSARRRIWREGTDVTIVSFGIGMTYALEAADKLAEEGISAEVIDLRTLRPARLPTRLSQAVMKTNRCVTVEEGWPVASIGNHITATLMERAFDYLDAPVINCTGKDVPMPYAANLERLALTSTAEVLDAVKQVTYR